MISCSIKKKATQTHQAKNELLVKAATLKTLKIDPELIKKRRRKKKNKAEEGESLTMTKQANSANPME